MDVLLSGLKALLEYLALNFLTILIPAFLLSGAIVTFISKDIIIDHLGSQTKKISSFSIAAGSGFFLSVCSCTVVPIASSVYASGATLAAAFVLIWMAPASNILALVYTNTVLGTSMVIARLVGALITSFVIGMIMYYSFRKEARKRVPNAIKNNGKLVSKNGVILLLLLLVWLLVPNYTASVSQYWVTLLIWLMGLATIIMHVMFSFGRDARKAWLRQTWSFAKSIVPLLILGVFIIGVIGMLLPPLWVSKWLGGNGFSQSFVASLLGAICYFPNMAEVPFIDTLMNLGMGPGPALALLINATGTSLPSWLIISKVFGVKKALVFASSVVMLGAIIGWIAGNMSSLFK